MQVSFQLPTRAVKHFEAWAGGHALAELGVAAEEAGFGAVAMTDHPFPPDAWLAAGGHHAFDPFVALSFLAAATSRVRLLTNLLVAGYRSPWLTAKALASLDLLSGGRVVVGVGAGYLEPEFAVLGADFADRGDRVDASLRALRLAWSGESVDSDDPHFPAHGHTALPRPTQRPGPPVWIGGNSRRARRRAAELGDGWMPFEQAEAQAVVTGTDVLSTVAELAERVGELRTLRRAAGRPETVDVCLAPQGHASAQEFADRAGHDADAWATAGVTWLGWESGARGFESCLAEIALVGSRLAAPLAAL